DHQEGREDELRPVRRILMNRKTVEQRSEDQPAPQFGEAEEQKLTRLLRQWREGVSLGSWEERQLARLLKDLVKARAADVLESEAFLRLVQPLAGDVEFSDDEKRFLIR